jgi:RNA polymerase sigma-70 factor (ECF subfamily)
MTLIPRRDDAEEILQRTAVTLWEKFSEYDQARPFMPWALRFAYFEALNFRKQMARDRLIFCEEILQALAESRETQAVLLSKQRAALSHCVTKLNSADRALLERRYNDAATIAALAEDVGRTVKSLYRRLDRIREALVRCVDRQLALEPAE